MDFIEDLRLVDGPVLWLSWAAGAVGVAYFLWQGGGHRTGPTTAPRWLAFLLPFAACLLGAAALVAGAHWLMIYVFSVFPGETSD